MNRTKLSIALITAALYSSMTHAAVPRILDFQGRLSGSGGVALQGLQSVTFRLYDVETDGVALWEETQDVSVTQGLFSVLLGADSLNPLPSLDGQLWLGIQVEADPEMSPRVQLTASPYALRASVAEAVLDDAVSSAALQDGAVVDADISATAAISGTKIQPDFGAQDVVTTGKLGVGTSAPGNRLHLFETAADATVRVETTSSTGNAILQLIAPASRASEVQFLDSALAGRLFYNHADDSLSVVTAGAEAMRITGGGEVGIGTETPTARLHVAGDLVVDGTISGFSGTADSDWSVEGDNVFRTTGNVGIGTSSPSTELHIEHNQNAATLLTIKNTDTGGSSFAGVRFLDGSATTGLTIGVQNNLSGSIKNKENSHLVLGTNDLERVRITADGNVGIGTTTPAHRLEVAGTLKATSFLGDGSGLTGIGSGTGGVINTGSTTIGADSDANGSGEIALQTRGTTRMSVTNVGKIGIGTTTPVEELQVKGNGTLAVFSTSGSAGAAINIENNFGGGKAWALGDNVDLEGTFSIKNVTDHRTIMALKPEGKVGIGTTSPVEELQVQGNGTLAVFSTTGSAGAAINIENNFGGGKAWALGDNVDLEGTFSIKNVTDHRTIMALKPGGKVGIGTKTPEALLSIESTSPTALKIGEVSFAPSRKQLLIGYDTLNNRAEIQSVEQDVAFRPLILQRQGGDVGIGTANPTARLHVAGDLVVDGTISGFSATADNDWVVDGGNVHRTSGNVGIGTNTPARKLSVAGEALFESSAGSVLITKGSAATMAGLLMENTGTGGRKYGLRSTNDLSGFGGGKFVISDNTTEDRPRLTIDAAGNVGIGTTTPVARLEVDGDASIADALLLGPGASATTSRGFIGRAGRWGSGPSEDLVIGSYEPGLHFATNNNTALRMSIDSLGNVGIGTTTPAAKLHVAGQVLCDGGCVSSSRELKQDIEDLDAGEAMEALAELRPTKFRYKHDPGEEHAGFIAEEVPELVAARGRKGLDAMDIVAVLTRVVQEQQRQIEAERRAWHTALAAQQERLERLEAELEQLKGR